MKGFGHPYKEKKKKNQKTKSSKEQIINQAIQFHSQGNISKATEYYKYFINQGFKDYRVFSNYGVILKGLGKLKEAEFSYYFSLVFYKTFFDSQNLSFNKKYFFSFE